MCVEILLLLSVKILLLSCVDIAVLRSCCFCVLWYCCFRVKKKWCFSVCYDTVPLVLINTVLSRCYLNSSHLNLCWHHLIQICVKITSFKWVNIILSRFVLTRSCSRVLYLTQASSYRVLQLYIKRSTKLLISCLRVCYTVHWQTLKCL